MKHFCNNPSLKFFIPIEITRLRIVSHLGKDRNPNAERLFGLQISQILIFRPNFRVFPGSFSNLSGNFLQVFSGSQRYLNYYQAPRSYIFTAPNVHIVFCEKSNILLDLSGDRLAHQTVTAQIERNIGFFATYYAHVCCCKNITTRSLTINLVPA